MAVHRLYVEPEPKPGIMLVEGDEAHHAARVKRLEIGAGVDVLDGRGNIGRARVAEMFKTRAGWGLRLDIASVEVAPAVMPRLEVWTAAAKGGRLEDTIDGLSQVGATAWGLLETDHSAVDPRPGKLDRLSRTASEACKQSGRAWRMELLDARRVEQAAAGDGIVVMADAGGEPYTRTGAPAIRVLIGPEGGWSPRELGLGIRRCRFGPHIMRIETAAIAAAAVIRHVEGC
jgi:16S rRNA (uracil1498-N3)-methyltransferase